MVNCAAYDDLCVDLKVTSYPFTTLYKDGEEIDAVRGGKNITVVSNTIEAALEKEKPGSRPRFVAMPTPGATVAPKVSLATTTEEESTKEGSTKEESTKEKYTTKGESTPEGSIDLPVDMAPVKVESVEQNVIAMRQRPTPNPEGVSIPLTAEDFQTQITYTRRPWFVKFYAPWCHHCQALAPSWEQLAKQMKGRLNIGEVNCDKESRLCKEAGIRGFPTMYYFRGGEKAEYDGLRGLGDLQHYAEYALDLSGRVPDVDAKSLAELEEKEDVIFIYFYDHATVSEDFNALDRLPINLIGRARLVKTNDPELYKRYKITTWPRLAVSREGRPTYYTPLTPSHVRDVDGVLAWMREVWLPIVPELSASNAREIMDGKIVTLGILNRDNEDSFQAAVREMKSAATEWMDKQIQLMQMERQELRDAKQLRIEEAEDRNDQRALRQAKHIRISLDKSDRKEVTFAWVDAAFWQRWVRTTYGVDIKDGDRVIINDEDVSLSPLQKHTHGRGLQNANKCVTRTAAIGTKPSPVTISAPPERPSWRRSPRSRPTLLNSSLSAPFRLSRRSFSISA